MTNESVEEYWTAEFGVPVEIREITGWAEFDVYVDGTYMVTTVSLEAAESYLEKYSMVRDEVSA